MREQDPDCLSEVKAYGHQRTFCAGREHGVQGRFADYRSLPFFKPPNLKARLIPEVRLVASLQADLVGTVAIGVRKGDAGSPQKI